MGILCVVAFGFIIIILVFHQRNVRNIQQKYSEFCITYNHTVDAYNEKGAIYNKLIEYLCDNNIDDLPSTVISKNHFAENFDSFYEEGSKQTMLDEELNQLDLELDGLNQSYNELCLSSYNKAVEEYNLQVDKYNSMINRLGAYNLTNIPNEETVKSIVSDHLEAFYSKCSDVEVICSEIETILSDQVKLQSNYYEMCLLSYNSVVSDYNLVANEYNEIVKLASIDFIDGMQKNIKPKEEYESTDILDFSEDDLCTSLESVMDDTDQLIGNYLMVKQITNPSEDWVKERLREVSSITGIQAVTKTNDPNGLLGKNGGYVSCIYFTITDISPDSVKGNSVVEKGTDAGGAIEVYDNLEHALNRCDYLSQFDGTLLYSGSYAIIGTMVIRTSYKLSDSQQVTLTNDITKALTEVK